MSRSAARRPTWTPRSGAPSETLTALLDDDVIFTGPDGNLYSKQDDPSGHRSGHQVLNRVDELELRVLATGATGVTWFMGTLEGTVSGEPFIARMRYTRTWVHDGQAGWKIVATHAMILSHG